MYLRMISKVPVSRKKNMAVFFMPTFHVTHGLVEETITDMAVMH